MSQSRKKIKRNSNKIIESDVSGVVKLYDDTGEYGIITEDDTRTDVSFIKSAVSKDSLRRDDPIRVGDEVIFDLFLAPEGYRAESVQIFSQDVEGSDSDDTDNLCLTGIGLRNKQTYQEENTRPHVALPNSTELVKQRERGNIFYTSATEDISATVRIRLENAITGYKSAFACSIKKVDEASALKKIGMASWKLATIALESEKEEADKSILKHFKEALKFFYMAYVLRSYKSVSWGAKLVESWENCLEETCEWLALLDTTERVAGFSELLGYAPDCSLKANGYIEYSTLLFHEGRTALQDGEYKECYRFMEECDIPIQEAKRLCEGDCSIKSEIAVLQEDVYIHTCVAESSMARERGDDLLEEHLKNEETVNTVTDTIRTVIGLYEQAAMLLCRDKDLEQEAIAYSRLGRVYGKVLNLPSRGKDYYKKAIQLALSMTPRTFHGVGWFKESTEFVEDFQKNLNKDEEEDKDKEAALNEMEEDVDKLSEMATKKGDLEFVKDIYKTWPPKAPGAKLNEKLSTKKLLLKAISHYHPDKVDKEVHGKKCYYFSQEITKHLTFKYSKRHSQVH